MELPLKGVSPFVGLLCSFYICLNSGRGVDLLGVVGDSQGQGESVGDVERQ